MKNNMSIDDWNGWGFIGTKDVEIYSGMLWQQKNPKMDYKETGSETSFFEIASRKGNGLQQFYLLCFSVGLRMVNSDISYEGSLELRGVPSSSFPKKNKDDGSWHSTILSLAELYGLKLGDEINRTASLGLNYIYKFHYNKSENYLDIKGIIDSFSHSDVRYCLSCGKYNRIDLENCSKCEENLDY